MPENRHKTPWTRLPLSGLLKALKVGASLALVAYLYYILAVANDVQTLYADLQTRISTHWKLLLAVIVFLVPFNLLLEALKFQRLLPASEQGTNRIGHFFLRVCAGLAVGIWTPNRVGEYAGRLVGSSTGTKTATIVSTLLGGIAQWVPLLLGGVFGGLYLNLNDAALPGYAKAIALGLTAVILLAYFHLDRLLNWGLSLWTPQQSNNEPASSPGLLRTVHQRLTLLAQTRLASTSILTTVLAFSVLRYVVYIVQISLAYALFGLAVPPLSILAGVAVLLLFQSFIPLPAGVQVLARAELSLLVWSTFAPSPLGVTAASLLILVLNLGLPALVGMVVILRSHEASSPS